MEIIQNNGKRIYLQLASGGGGGAVSSVFGRAGDVVAASGDYSYSQISGKPVFAPVATSGSYNDLSNKPTIPAPQIQSSWLQGNPFAVDYIIGKPAFTTGITQLTGDGTAGPGNGSQPFSLALVNANPGIHGDATHVPRINFDSKGRALSITDVPISSGITQLTADVTAGPGSGSVLATLANTGIAPGTIGDSTHTLQITFDAKGRALAATVLAIPGVSGTSFPTTEQLGVLHNGTDQSTALNNAFLNPNYKGIIFDFLGGGAVTISATVNCQGKYILFKSGSFLTATTLQQLNNCIIGAAYDIKIADTNVQINPTGTVSEYYSLKWHGATGDGSTDDYAALQIAIDDVVYNSGVRNAYLPGGTYRVTKGLMWRTNHGGRNAALSFSDFTNSIKWVGEGDSTGTRINIDNKNSFGVNLQRVKSFYVEGIYVTGQNLQPILYNGYQIAQDSASTFLSTGIRDNHLSPHICWVVDGIGQATIANVDRYPDFTPYYLEVGNGGSTDVIFNMCRAQFGSVGFGISVNGTTQNGEKISLLNCWSDYSKSSISTGSSQNRTVKIDNLTCWGGCKYVFNQTDYGDGTGCPPEVSHLNVAGFNRFLWSACNTVSKGLIIDEAHIEGLYSLGGNFLQLVSELTITNSWVNMIGSQALTTFPVLGTSINPPYTVFQGGALRMKNVKFWQFGDGGPSGPVHVPQSISSLVTNFEDCTFDAIPINNIFASYNSSKNISIINTYGDNQSIGYVSPGQLHTTKQIFTSGMRCVYTSGKTRTKVENSGSNYKDIRVVPFSAPVTLTGFSANDLQAQFTLSTSSNDFKMLMVGDNLLFQVTDEYGRGNVITAFAQIININAGTGVVTIAGTARGVGNGSFTIFIERYDYLLQQVIVGDITVGSNIISNVVVEGGIGFQVGLPVYMPHFQSGAFVQSFNGVSQITMSHNAIISENNVCIVSSQWKGEEYGVANPSDPSGLGYKRGDIIYNNRTDLNPAITYWLCTKPGITNSAKLPTFQAYP